MVSQYFPPEVGATQSRMQSFAEYLASRGHEVTVIAEFPNHPQGVIPARYGGRFVEDDRSNGYRVLRVWVKTSDDKTQATRLAFYGSFMPRRPSRLAPLAGRADVVLATSPPLFTGLAGVSLARMNRRAARARRARPLACGGAGARADRSGVPMRLAVGLEHWLYRRSDAVVAVTLPFCRTSTRIRSSVRRAPR